MITVRKGWSRILLVVLCIPAMALAERAHPGVAGQTPPAETREGASPGARAETDERRKSHERMVEILARIAADADTAVKARRAGQAIDALSESDADPASRWLGLVQGAEWDLVLGKERDAIEKLTEARALIEKEADEPGTHERLLHTEMRLGVAWLRLGETENCAHRRGTESCILPIRGDGIHTEKEGSRHAIEHFRRVIDETPPTSSSHFTALWLYNIGCMTLGLPTDGCDPEQLIPVDLFRSEEEIPRFHNVAASTGLDTFSTSGGAVVDDFDGDGQLDVFVSAWDPGGQIRFFRNGGDGRFVDRTEEAGLKGIFGGLNMVQADYDGDGHLDLLVLRGAWMERSGQVPNSLLRNNGDGTFSDVTFLAGLGERHLPTQTAAWADYDNDGDLDLYIGNEHSGMLRAAGQLFRNDGRGGFSDVAPAAGVENLRYAKGVVWGDYDGDQRQDLYVSNLGGDNRLYRNLGDGTFEDVASSLGVAGPRQSFPVWFWDYDNDGDLDLYVSSYALNVKNAVGAVAASYMGYFPDLELARLYRNDSGRGFRDVAPDVNLRRLTMPMGANFGDLDNDGYLDFYLGTGYDDYAALMPNVMYLNRSGSRFVDVTTAGGFGHLQKGHGVAFADLDNDGDVDVFEQMGGAFPGDRFADALYRNPGFGNRSITVTLVGARSNRSAIGARIRIDLVEDAGRRTVYRWVNSGGSFGANPLRQTIGLGKASAIASLRIDWPIPGSTQTFEDVPMDRSIRIVEGVETIEVSAP